MDGLFEYKQEMDALHFTSQQKAQMAAQAAKEAGRTGKKSRRFAGRTAVIAACLAAVLTVGAGASGILKSAVEAFANVFGENVAQTEVIDKIGHPIGAGDTDNGITITADAIMGDEYNAVIIYTLTREDGERFLPVGMGLDDTGLMIGGFGGASWARGGSHGGAWFIDEDPEDNRIQYVETVSSDVSLTRGTATAEFEDLRCWNQETERDELLYEGNWKFRFSVDYEDSSVHFDGGETFSQDGITFTIEEVTVSPIAVHVAYTADEAVVWDDAPSGRQSAEGRRQSGRFMENVEILLTKTDGTVIDLSNFGGGISPDYNANISRCTKGGVLEEIIPLEEMESISVGGVVYEING